MERSSELKCPRAALILWDDAKSISGWTGADDLDIEQCKALGFVMYEGLDFIGIASTVDHNAAEGNGIMTIPKGMIRALIYLPDGVLDELLRSALGLSDA